MVTYKTTSSTLNKALMLCLNLQQTWIRTLPTSKPWIWNWNLALIGGHIGCSTQVSITAQVSLIYTNSVTITGEHIWTFVMPHSPISLRTSVSQSRATKACTQCTRSVLLWFWPTLLGHPSLLFLCKQSCAPRSTDNLQLHTHFMS